MSRMGRRKAIPRPVKTFTGIVIVVAIIMPVLAYLLIERAVVSSSSLETIIQIGAVVLALVGFYVTYILRRNKE